MSITISLFPTHIPLLFLFFLYFFLCFLLPLHSPINTSLFFSSQHTILLRPFFNTPSHIIFLAIHIFHSLILRVFKTSWRRGDVYTITTSHQPNSPPSSSPQVHGFGWLAFKDSRACGLRVLHTFHMV